jgi:hypothetical protein
LEKSLPVCFRGLAPTTSTVQGDLIEEKAIEGLRSAVSFRCHFNEHLPSSSSVGKSDQGAGIGFRPWCEFQVWEPFPTVAAQDNKSSLGSFNERSLTAFPSLLVAANSQWYAVGFEHRKAMLFIGG